METLVSDIMKNQVISIDSSMSVKDAAKMMSDSGVGCLVVIRENIPVGILTERDFVTRIVFLAEPSSMPVRDVMSSPLIAIRPKETIRNLAELMKEKKIHKVPVVDGNKLVGIVTATDLIRKCVIGSDLDMKQICSSFAQMAF
ncbi:MAG: CBS domain-containing protein [Nitrosotalea sp.]